MNKRINRDFLFIPGINGFDYDDDVFPAGWTNILDSLSKFGAASYVSARVWHNGKRDEDLLLKSTRQIDDSNIIELMDRENSNKLSSLINPYKNNDIPLFTVWNDSKDFNASALRLSNCYAININIGMFVLIYRYFYEFCKLPEFFPEIDGEEIKEINEYQEFNTFKPWSVPRHLTMQKAMLWCMGVEALNTPKRYPKKRLVLQEFLTLLCMQIIIAHEVSHIIAGHVDEDAYIFSRPEEDITEEEIELTKPSIGKLWEVEADVVSMQLVLAYLPFKRFESFMKNYLSVLGLPFEKETLFGLLFLGIQCVYFIHASMQSKVSDNQHHPHFYTRLRILQITAAAIMSEKYGINGNDFLDKYWFRYNEYYNVAAKSVGYPYSEKTPEERIKMVKAETLKADGLVNKWFNEKYKWERFSLIQSA